MAVLLQFNEQTSLTIQQLSENTGMLLRTIIGSRRRTCHLSYAVQSGALRR